MGIINFVRWTTQNESERKEIVVKTGEYGIKRLKKGLFMPIQNKKNTI